MPQPTPPSRPKKNSLVRYGVQWSPRQDKPLLSPMYDGYWTPWHIAQKRIDELEEQLRISRGVSGI